MPTLSKVASAEAIELAGYLFSIPQETSLRTRRVVIRTCRKNNATAADVESRFDAQFISCNKPSTFSMSFVAPKLIAGVNSCGALNALFRRPFHYTSLSIYLSDALEISTRNMIRRYSYTTRCTRCDTFNRVKQDSIVSVARRDYSRQKRGIIVVRSINSLSREEVVNFFILRARKVILRLVIKIKLFVKSATHL